MIRPPPNGRPKASKARLSCCHWFRLGPLANYKEGMGVIAYYVEVRFQGAGTGPRVVALASMGANRTKGWG